MASLVSQLIVRLVDEVTGPIRRITDSVRRLPNSLDQAAEANAARMGQLRGQMVDAIGVGYALARGLAAPIHAASEFQASMNRVGAALDETTEEFAALEAAALEMGRTTSFTAIESADAIETLAKNGLNAAQILGGALNASLLLAASSGTDIANAADIATDVMLQFGKQADEMGGVVDGITGVLLASKFGIDDYRLALAQAGGVAGGLGMDFADFNASIAATSSLFASGSDAGTSFKTFLTRLVPDTESAAAVMNTLGLEFFNVDGSMKSMAEVAGELQEGFAGLSDEAKNQALKTLFGTDAMRTAIGFIEQGADGIDRLIEAIARASAAEQAAAKLEGYRGELTKLKSAIEGLNIAIGTAFLPGLTSMFQALGKVVIPLTALATTYPKVTRTIVAGTVGLVAFRVATIAAAYGATFMQGALIGVIRPIVGLTWGLMGLLNPLALVRNGLMLLKLALIGTGIGLALVAIGAAGAFIWQNWEGIGAAFEAFKLAFDQAIGPAGDALAPVIQGLKDLWGWVQKVTGPLDFATWMNFGAEAGRVTGTLVADMANAAAAIADFGSAFAIDPAAALAPFKTGFDHVLMEMRLRVFDLVTAFREIDWSAVATSIGDGLGSAIGSYAGFVTSLYEVITAEIGAIDWRNAGAAVARGIIDLGLMAIDLGGAAVRWMGKLLDGLTSGAGETDWSGVGMKIVDLILAAGGAGLAFMQGFFAEIFAALGEIDWAQVGIFIGEGILNGLRAVGGQIREFMMSLLPGWAVDMINWSTGGGEAAAPEMAAAAPAVTIGADADARMERVGDNLDNLADRSQIEGSVMLDSAAIDVATEKAERLRAILAEIAAMGNATGRRVNQLQREAGRLEGELSRSRATSLEGRPPS